MAMPGLGAGARSGQASKAPRVTSATQLKGPDELTGAGMTGRRGAPPRQGTPPWAVRAAGWVRGSRAGLLVIAALVGVGSGLGAVVFRYLVYLFTWLATGHVAFGQDGYAESSHLPWLGLAFFVVTPVIGGLIYGPLIFQYAREARGHGVPEVMIAVAQNGGRIRPQVSAVKAVASALCIGTGGSVGREGPIVQIGSAMASAFGQWAKMPENRMRILVACGASGGIAATFNAPVTGVFFGVEIILRELSIDALFTVMASAVLADAVAIPFLGDRRFLAGFPPGIALRHPQDYLLVTVLAVAAALIGVVFKNAVYKTEDLCDRLWGDRPEWARPAVGGIALGLVLLAVPQLYGVGYPVMYKAVAGGYVLWFLLVLAAGKIIACSLTLGIGGSGGVFAPSLFIGATSGMAFGEIASHLLGPAAGPPPLYAVVAMGAVFASAARAPLTSVASVVEMTGDYTLTLPVMLAVAIATAASRALSYGTIYTTKLLRRGYDIDRATPWRALGDLTAADAMRPFSAPLTVPGGPQDDTRRPGSDGRMTARGPVPLPGPVTSRSDPQAVLADQSLAAALRQLAAYGRDGLPVLSSDGRQAQGWITNDNALQAIAREAGTLPAQAQATPVSGPAARASPPQPPTPLPGYQVLEITIGPDSPVAGKTLATITWPRGWVPVSILRHRSLHDSDPGFTLAPGDRISLLALRHNNDHRHHPGREPSTCTPAACLRPPPLRPRPRTRRRPETGEVPTDDERH
jgi:chloride channel protein, CIC family